MPRKPHLAEMPESNPNIAKDAHLRGVRKTLDGLLYSMQHALENGNAAKFAQVLDDIESQVKFARFWVGRIPSDVPPVPVSKVDVMIDEAGRAQFERDMSEHYNGMKG